jgi:hypothetical protein
LFVVEKVLLTLRLPRAESAALASGRAQQMLPVVRLFVSSVL